MENRRLFLIVAVKFVFAGLCVIGLIRLFLM